MADIKLKLLLPIVVVLIFVPTSACQDEDRSPIAKELWNWEFWTTCEILCKNKFQSLKDSYRTCNRALIGVIICQFYPPGSSSDDDTQQEPESHPDPKINQDALHDDAPPNDETGVVGSTVGEGPPPIN